MSSEAELMVLFGGLHLLGLGLAGMLFFVFLRSDTAVAWTPPREDDDGGGGGPAPPRTPGRGPSDGGLPLPDARPARVRLREPARLADLLPSPPRRGAPEPRRVPTRTP